MIEISAALTLAIQIRKVSASDNEINGAFTGVISRFSSIIYIFTAYLNWEGILFGCFHLLCFTFKRMVSVFVFRGDFCNVGMEIIKYCTCSIGGFTWDVVKCLHDNI